jgi:hypothetical protein
MKRILTEVVSILGLVALGVAIVLAVNFRPKGEPHPILAYPGSNLDTQVSTPTSPYPPPIPPGNNGSVSCYGLGEWKIYTNQKAGYSLKYPAESVLKEFIGSDKDYTALDIWLKPSCHTKQQCNGSNRVAIGVFDNPDHLGVYDFAFETFETPTWSSMRETMHSNLENSGRYVTIAGVQVLRVEDGLNGKSKPDIFVPNEDVVIRFQIIETGMVPPFDPPCETTLILLDEILASIKLFTPTK